MEANAKSLYRQMPRFLLLLVLGTSTLHAQDAAPDLERMASARIAAFFDGKLRQQDFSVTSAWRRNFNPVNLADKAELRIDALDIVELRLPDNPDGLEAVFSVRVQVPTASFVSNELLAAGGYIFAGSMNFYHTTRGYLVRDCSFTIINTEGDVVGSNYLPWQSALARAEKEPGG